MVFSGKSPNPILPDTPGPQYDSRVPRKVGWYVVLVVVDR